MAGEWRERPLAELTDNFDGIRVPVKEADRRAGPYPYYGASGVVDHVDRYLFDGEYLLIAEDGENLRTRNTPVAFLARGKFWVNNHAHIVRGNSEADTRFLMYALSAADISGYLTGSTMPKLTQGNMNRIPLFTPPLPEQRAIAHILGTLDDKIELNRRMSETLEAMARALFKSWFVDFDPVRAKAAGRARQDGARSGQQRRPLSVASDLPWPGAEARAGAQGDPGQWQWPQHILDLFPARLVDSDLGEIPEGWQVSRFAETIEIVGGGTPKTSVEEYWDGNIPWFSVVDAPSGSEVWVVDTEKKVTHSGVENSSTRVLPVGTTIISARGTVGRVALVGVPMAMNQSCYGLRGRSGGLGFYNYFSTRELVGRLQRHAHGSVFDTITRDTLAGVSVVRPPAELINEFEKRVGPSLERIRAALLDTRTLAALRDALLPKLISGELRVKNAERFVERVL